jgi:SAM-dependent methyltransferase
LAAYDELVAEALSAPFSGWDFSWLAARSPAGGLPWSYRSDVARLAVLADTMLDMGTGGGEVLSRLAVRSRHTVATEAWPLNVAVAASRLGPFGIPVVRDEGAANNMQQDGSSRGRLPFRDGAFGLVANRHEAFRADEVSRVLAPGGTFITQQVDYHSYDDLHRLVGLEMPDQPESWLPIALRQVRAAGLTVQAAVRGEERYEFRDVGAIVYYLRVISWAIPEYSLDRFGAALRAAHETSSQWPALVRQRRFLLIAVKQ